MYNVYADKVCIYSDAFVSDKTKAVNPKLILEDNSAGSFSVTLPQSNAGYESVARMTTDISVCKNGKEIWSGRVLSESKDFWNNRVLYCEGELAFLNDSTQPQAEYPELTVRGFLERIIAVHNSKVTANRRFVIGAVTVHTSEDTQTWYTNYEKTIECINNQLLNVFGGHIRVRNVNGLRTLDYLGEYPNTNTQVIRFGKNLLDFTRKWDASEFATAIVPLGNRLNESPIENLDAYLTVESVNSGKLYVESEDAVASYGWIEKVVKWDDVSDSSELLEKARTYLSDIQFDNVELELSALDLHYLDAVCEDVKLLDEIRVISHPHGMDRLFPVTKLEIPLDSPEKTQFQLGDSVQTSLTEVNKQLNSELLHKIESLPKSKSILEEAKTNATEIMNMATNGFITITKGQYGTDTLYISSEQDYTRSKKLWKWNVNGLGYSKDGGETFGLAITMDGAIVADFITTGNMSADRITTGRLQDRNLNVIFDLYEGSLTMKKGSISIGDVDSEGVTAFSVSENGDMYARRGTFAGTLVGAGGTFGGKLVAVEGDFKGVVQASDFLDRSGNSMMANGKFSSGYVDLYGMTVTNRETGETSFQLDNDGKVTINGKIIMGEGSSINWGTVSEINLSDNAAYGLANSASDAASSAQSTANSAVNAAGAAQSTADSAKTTATAAASAAENARNMAVNIANGQFSGGTFINGKEIYSPTIYADEFIVIPEHLERTSGGFILYGYFDNTLRQMLKITYADIGERPLVSFLSPVGATAQWSFSQTSFYNELDFTNANVKGLYLKLA